MNSKRTLTAAPPNQIHQTQLDDWFWQRTTPASLQQFLYKRWHKLPRARTNPDLFYRNKGIKLKCSHWVSRVHKYAPMDWQHLLCSAPSKPPRLLFLWTVLRSTVASLSPLQTADQRKNRHFHPLINIACRFQEMPPMDGLLTKPAVQSKLRKRKQVWQTYKKTFFWLLTNAEASMRKNRLLNGWTGAVATE